MKLSGFGRSVIQRLVKTNVKKNLYFEIKESVIEESISSHGVSKRKALVRRYGLNSDKEVRARLIEILYERVNYHKDKFIAPALHEEMTGMQVKRSGKVEHSDNTHDDLVFSYLMALYVWYDGHNVMENFNIMKNTIKTDTEEEILEGDIDRDTKVETVKLQDSDIVNDEMVTEQLMYINNPKKGILAQDFHSYVTKTEEDEVNYMVSTDRVFKQAYNDKYHNAEDSGVAYNVDIPLSVFMDDDPEIEEEMNNRKLHGNLYDQFMDL